MSERTPQITFYFRYLYPGGAERILLTILRSLTEKGITVDCVLHKIGGPLMSEIPPNVRIIELKTPRLFFGLLKLANYLRQESPQCLLSAMHLMNEVAIVAKYLAGRKTKVIVCEHNTLSVHSASQKSLERWSPLSVKLLYPWADEVIAVSHGVATDLHQVTGFPLDKIKVIYNPVITPKQLEMSLEPLEHPWFAQGQPPVILGVGRLNQQKDFPTLIKAFAQVLKAKPARLMILGDGKEKNQLQQLIKDLKLENEVCLLGLVNNPYNYMKRATVFVLSSLWEGLPTVLIEAMAMGTPVVSTNCPSGPAEVLDNGKYGDLVPLGDSQAIADSILQILAGKIKKVDSHWLEQFSLDSAVDQYLKILNIG